MNIKEWFVFSSNEKNFQSENGGFELQNVMKNNIQLGVSQSQENSNVYENLEVRKHKESVSKRTRLSPEFIHQEQDIGSTCTKPKVLGLKLTMTPSFIGELNKMGLPIEKKPRQGNKGLSSRRAKTKVKPYNFPATYIKIGEWERMARNETGLVAKLYHAKRKLIWEILDGPFKSKMEIQWSDICAIRAITPENELGLLEIELIKPPVYYREICPQPRRHTLWQQSSDFTDGQASIWRRHQVAFPPGILEKNYEKLLQYDKELDALSTKPFPRYECPYFEPALFTLNFSGYGAHQAATNPNWSYPTIIPSEPLSRETSNPSPSVLDLPFTYQGGGNNCFVAQNQTSWEQSLSIPRDNFGIHEAFGISSTITNINNVYDTPLPSTMNANNVYYPSFPLAINDNNLYDPSHYDPNMFGLPTGIQTDLLDNVQLDDALLEATGSISSMLETIGSVNNINEPSYQPDLDFHAINGDQVNNNNYGSNGMILDSIHMLVAQDSNGSSENVFRGLHQDAFIGSNGNMFQGADDNMLPSANGNMFELAGNNPMDMGVEDFFDLYPFYNLIMIYKTCFKGHVRKT